MGTNRTRKPRSRKPKAVELDDSIRRCLLYGDAEPGTPGHSLRIERFFDGGRGIREAWQAHGKTLLATWQGPGRPWAEKYGA